MDKLKKEEIEFFHDNLTEKEKEEAKQNGYILVGTRGAGKTTLLNAIFNKEMKTKIPIYYYKSTNGNVVCLIETPGLIDNYEDINIKDWIIKIISEEKVHIKGIFFLFNFQFARFDLSEQEALLKYHSIFPLRNFWKYLVIINTHFFSDPNEEEDIEEIKQKKNTYLGTILEKMMDKVKDISDPIPSKDLIIKYFDSYNPYFNMNQKRKKNNDMVRQELEDIFDEFNKKNPLFSRIKIIHIKDTKWKEDGKLYNVEVEIIQFFDINKEPIKEKLNFIKKEEIYQG